MEFKDRIKKVRSDLHLTQLLFAEEMGVKQKTISNWESGRNEPNIDALCRISTKWAIDLNWLVCGIGEEPKEKPYDKDAVLPIDVIGSTTDFLLIDKRVFSHDVDRDHLVAILVNEDVLEPDIKEGKWVVADTTQTGNMFGHYVVEIADTLMVRLLSFKKDTIVAKTTKPQDQESYSSNEIKIIGKVINIF